MKKIALTQGQCALVDDDDYAQVSAHKWCAFWSHDSFKAIRNENGRTVYMHREITHAADGEQVDHKDGNDLNNQKDNLRIVTHSQQMMNRGRRNKAKGVGLWYGRWRARIMKDGISHFLGYYTTEIEATAAYNAAAKELHGEYAVLNRYYR